MVFLFSVILVGAYAMAVSRVACHGPARLWLTASGFLLLIVIGGVFLGRHYSVQSIQNLLLYLIALTGPIVVVPTALLSQATATRSTMSKAFPTAIFGACFGLVCGFIIVVWGLGVW